MQPDKRFKVNQDKAKKQWKTDCFVQDIIHQIIDNLPDTEDNQGPLIIAPDSDEDITASPTSALDIASRDDEGKNTILLLQIINLNTLPKLTQHNDIVIHRSH